MFKLNVGQKVVFEFNGVNRLGTIESIKEAKKSPRYSVRDECGNLYAPIGTDTVVPGKVLLKISEAYFKNHDVNMAPISVIFNDENDEDGISTTNEIFDVTDKEAE